MKKGWIMLAALLVVLSAASFTAARLLSAGSEVSGQPEPLLGVLPDYLDLTPEQRQHLDSVNADYASQRRIIRQRMWDARDRFAAVMRNPDSTREQALAAMERFGAAREDMAANTLEYVFEVRRVLTPEQRSKLAEVMDRGVCALSCGPGGGCGGPMGAGGMGPGQGRRGPRWAR